MRRDATRPEHRTHPRQAAKSPADNARHFHFHATTIPGPSPGPLIEKTSRRFAKTDALPIQSGGGLNRRRLARPGPKHTLEPLPRGAQADSAHVGQAVNLHEFFLVRTVARRSSRAIFAPSPSSLSISEKHSPLPTAYLPSGSVNVRSGSTSQGR